MVDTDACSYNTGILRPKCEVAVKTFLKDAGTFG
jgi:hypothetical protein